MVPSWEGSIRSIGGKASVRADEEHLSDGCSESQSISPEDKDRWDGIDERLGLTHNQSSHS